MGDFHRSPSKVWWHYNFENSQQISSQSPGSLDSGFSDTENSPPAQLLIHGETPKDILKNISEEDSTKSQNLSINFKQKHSPKKSITLHLSGNAASDYVSETPTRKIINDAKVQSEPIKKHRFYRNGSLKVSRNLFKHVVKESANDTSLVYPYQYAEDINDGAESQCSNTSSKVKRDDSHLWKSDDNSIELLEGVKTFPLGTNNISYSLELNKSAPAILPSRENKSNISIAQGNFAQDSDCDSELETAFHGLSEHPRHTSTPKITSKNFRNMKHHRYKRAFRTLTTNNDSRFEHYINIKEEPPSVQKWLEEVKELYEPECTTALQCKSIATELAQTVARVAARATSTLRKILTDYDLIAAEFENIKYQKQHTGALAQSLIRLIEEFVDNYLLSTNNYELLKLCENIKSSHIENLSELIVELKRRWETSQDKVLSQEIKKLVNKLEDPPSELHIRALVTGLTSIALRNKEIINILISCNTVQILCVLCEKCESSTVRSLILRALSTVCCSNMAIRKFENCSGIQLITDTLSEETRPEPERSEAVALLAQVTAPWVEDSRYVQGLREHVKTLVTALTNFISITKCCQNLLLCTAALANLTEMESSSIKHLLYQNSIGNILKTIKLKGSLISIYLLEQTAILIANLSSVTSAHKLLAEEHAPEALLHFLQYKHTDKNIEGRLQQKSIIALSRLSNNREAAQQIVKCSGINRLVTLCRNRKERHDSDAVLVAALATLRKIVETCGNDVIDTLDFQELIEPKLLDSFLAYSTQSESYV